MEEDKKKIWFPAKKYGYGWGLPITWQGWLVLMAYLLLIIIGILILINNPSEIGAFRIYVLLFTIVFIFICWKKGEKPAWRWGDKRRQSGEAKEGRTKSSI